MLNIHWLSCPPFPTTHCLFLRPRLLQLQVSVDDETGYTTSEEQGDRGESILSSAPTPPIPPAGNKFTAKVSPGSASTRTLGSAFAAMAAGVDKGVQCLAPEPRMMVSRASQCEGPARVSISAGVQCSMPVSSCGSQCRSDIRTRASTGVQCSLLVENDAGEEFQGAAISPTLAGVGSAGSLADLSKDDCEEACDVNSDGKTALPRPLGPSEQAQLIRAAAAIDSSASAWVDDRGTAPKSKKKRRKPKATEAAVRPPTVEGAASRSSGGSHTTGGGLGDWTRGLTRRVFLCGIVGVVLAGVWGMAGRPGGRSWQGHGVLTRHGAHKGQEDRAQPPVWVIVGGSLTLGDVLASHRPEEHGAGEVQWFKDGRLLPGQIRWVEYHVLWGSRGWGRTRNRACRSHSKGLGGAAAGLIVLNGDGVGLSTVDQQQCVILPGTYSTGLQN